MQSEEFEEYRRQWQDTFWDAIGWMNQADLFAIEGALENNNAQEFFDIFASYLGYDDGSD